MAPRVDRIVLAQASLAHLAEPLAEQLGLQVFASPELLVQEVVARARGSA
jgi:phosphoserine phosphatase